MKMTKVYMLPKLQSQVSPPCQQWNPHYGSTFKDAIPVANTGIYDQGPEEND